MNPLRERGLVRFAHPQEPLGLLGRGTEIADLYLQVRVGGDVALLRGIAKARARAGGAPSRQRARPELPERLDLRLRGLSARGRGGGLEDAGGAQRRLARAAASGRGALRGCDARDRLLGDGHHAAPPRRRQRAGDREPAAAAREHRRARRRSVSRARTQQRAGRSHHGHHRAPAAGLPGAPRRRVRLRAAARARLRHAWRRSRRCATAARASSSGSAATSRSRAPMPSGPRARSRAATSRRTSRPSSTARTWWRAASRCCCRASGAASATCRRAVRSS